MARLTRICLSVVIVLAIVASGYITQRMYAHQQSLKEGSRYNTAWSVSQAVTEYTRLQLALAQMARGGSAADVELRYDICLNRLKLMTDGEVWTFLQTDPRHVATLRTVEDILTRLRPEIERIGAPEAAARASRLLAPATGSLVALAAAANRHGGERVAADEADLFALHWMFTGLAASLIGGGIGLIVLLTRRMNELRATRDTLEATAERLGGALVEADAAGQAKATFLATMSHEIRTPLNAMLGLTTSLLDEVKAGPHRTLLETIRDAGDSLLRLLNDILDFSKLDAKRMTFEETPFAPGALSANVASILEPRAKSKGISLFVLTDPTLPPGVLGDPGRVEQILINLVSNAVKFTEHGHVTIQTLHEPAKDGESTVVWRVSDTGIGIPADRIGKLFTDFMQADNSITRRFGGTGLGLAISKRLVDEMGGVIAVESTAGAGAVFTVRLTLPVAASPVAETAHGDDAVARFTALIRGLGRPLRILFVEDNPTNQYVATQLLKGFDVRLDMAGNGLEALDSVSRFTHDLICMDMRMPEMDGLEATRQIRQMGGRMAVIPIIALTANAFKDDVDACLDAGMNRFVSKPVRRDVLLGAMLAELSGRECDAAQGDRASSGGAAGRGASSGAVSLGVPEDLLADFPLDPSPSWPSSPPSRPRALASPASSPRASSPALLSASPSEPAVLDTVEFDGLIEMIGEEGVLEMIAIFETETRRRVARLRGGNQDIVTVAREMHTLKGAAGTVAAPRLAALGKAFEAAANQGTHPTPEDVQAIEDALDAFLGAIRGRAVNRAAA